jgi:hypothetical protein
VRCVSGGGVMVVGDAKHGLFSSFLFPFVVSPAFVNSPSARKLCLDRRCAVCCAHGGMMMKEVWALFFGYCFISGRLGEGVGGL